jgi:Fic family protein
VIERPKGYQAFIANPLPPVPAIDLTSNVRALLSWADHALGLLEGAALMLPSPELVVFMYIRKEAVLSSQIEGTQSSLQDVLAAEAKLFDPHTPSDVVNYVRAMQHGPARGVPQQDRRHHGARGWQRASSHGEAVRSADRFSRHRARVA